ncbi:MAG: UvrD-helicase domain-containing protein [Planctomycetota bacterium]
MRKTEDHSAAILADLNEPQRAAVTHGEGPLLVVAGPGSGKTRVITRRAAHLVQRGIPPRNILAITFTNKAADEMRRRIEALGVRQGMWIYTFHALGARLLREFGELARVQPGFTIYDDSDSLRVIKEAMEATGTRKELVSAEALATAISGAKARLETPEQFEQRADASWQRVAATVYAAYQSLLEQRNAVDFDDLLMRVALVLEEHEEVRARLNVRFRHVLIDEYQDTNHAQYLIARDLCEAHQNICATGDPDQSIYAWRGADLRNILDFEHDFPNARVVRLEQNYRSTGRILRAADCLIAHNRDRKPKTLWTNNPDGPAVRVWQFDSGDREAERIAATIQTLRRKGRSWSDFAVFYRVNAVSRGFEEALRARGIPYKIVRGVEFYSRKEIRDVLAYLRVLTNPADDVALERILNTPPRGIGKMTEERLRAYAAETRRPLLDVLRHADDVPGLRGAAAKIAALVALLDELKAWTEGPVSQAVSDVLAHSGLEAMFRREHERGGEDRLANVQELVTAARRYEQEVPEASLADFLHRVSLVNDQDAVDEQAGCVLLMTLHAAKGLEFPVVFLVGLEQGLLPHERALRTAPEVEEERRLCFVGMTRACEELYLSRAQERVIRGRPMPRAASQFLREADDGGLRWEDFRLGCGGPAGYGPTDNFVPLPDDLPPEEAARLAPPRRWQRTSDSEDDVDARDENAAPSRLGRRRPPVEAEPPAAGAYADWAPGTLVRHAVYGVGQVVWIHPAGAQTRAGLRFPGYGEKTLILAKAPVQKLERR